MTATFIIKSIFFQNANSSLKKVIVDNIEYEYSLEKEIQIKFNEIEFEIGIKTVNIKLEFNGNYENHFFEIMKGTKIYGYLLPNIGKTLDILLNEQSKVNSKIQDINSLNFADLDIKENRLLIINFNSSYELYINDEEISDKLDLRGNSLQISIPALKEKYYFYKYIEPIDYDIFFKVYEKLKVLASIFFLKVKEELIISNNTESFINKILSYE